MTIDVSDVAGIDAGEGRRNAAARIATEVRRADRLGQTRLTKVTSLLHAFRTQGTPTKLIEVVKELDEQGIHLDSGWLLHSKAPDIRRPGVLEFSLRSPVDDAPVVPGCDETIQMSVWSPGNPVGDERPLTRQEEPESGDVLWYNIDPPVMRESYDQATSGSEIDRVRRTTPRRGGNGPSTKHEAQGAFEQRVAHVFWPAPRSLHRLDRGDGQRPAPPGFAAQGRDVR